MSKYRILLVENDPQICRMFAKNTDPIGDIKVDMMYYSDDIVNCMGHADTRNNNYIAVIADMNLISEDNIAEIAKRSNEYGFETEIILTSDTVDGDGTIQISDFKPMYLLKKPIDFGFLMKLICQIKEIARLKGMVSESSNRETELAREIADTLKSFGISKKMKGYTYLFSAVEFVVEESETVDQVTKLLYPKVARMYHTTAVTVERMIRHAIDEAWQKENAEICEKYLAKTGSRNNARPTNSEFISCVVSSIKQKINKEDV